uniref:Chitin-binding type-2 domain-containing protein n=2 Tax=Lutzomyia longipalpis TaxID=7200 RepID=A0A1B0CTK7_LUTLO
MWKLSFVGFVLFLSSGITRGAVVEMVAETANKQPTLMAQEVPMPITKTQEVNEILSKTRVESISPAAIQTLQNCTNRMDTYCYDCRSIVMCALAETPVYQGVCPPETPFCDSQYNRCAITLGDPIMDLLCQEGAQLCTSRGYFPDVYDSRIYHYCAHQGDVMPVTYRCPADYIYDSYSQGCKRIIPYDCSGKDNKFVTHTLYPGYYAFCRVMGGTHEIIPYKCRDELNFAFNTKTNACEYQCKDEGRFVDRESCDHYYECYRSEGGYTYQRIKCGEAYHTYDKQLQKCVPYYAQCEPEVGWD